MPVGAPGEEKIILNVDSLWSGGPFTAIVGAERENLLTDAKVIELHRR